MLGLNMPTTESNADSSCLKNTRLFFLGAIADLARPLFNMGLRIPLTNDLPFLTRLFLTLSPCWLLLPACKKELDDIPPGHAACSSSPNFCRSPMHSFLQLTHVWICLQDVGITDRTMVWKLASNYKGTPPKVVASAWLPALTVLGRVPPKNTHTKNRNHKSTPPKKNTEKQRNQIDPPKNDFRESGSSFFGQQAEKQKHR